MRPARPAARQGRLVGSDAPGGTPPGRSSRLARPAPVTARARRLLTCGAVAGPLFVGVTAVEALTRDGFDLRRHGISLLSLGDRGWIQVANFVVAGALSVGFGVGVRRLLGRGPAVPLIWGYGAGLIATGVFLVDPGVGFPPGSPAGPADPMSWHGAVHAAAPPFAFICLAALCVVFARWFVARGRMGWAAYSLFTAAAAVLLILLPGGGGSVRSALAVVLSSAWLTGVALMLRRTAAGSVESGPGLQPGPGTWFGSWFGRFRLGFARFADQPVWSRAARTTRAKPRS